MSAEVAEARIAAPPCDASIPRSPPLPRRRCGDGQDAETRRPYVLVVEDDPDLRSTVVDVLRLDGYAVRQAVDGIEALEHLKAGKERPFLILLDLMMPRMDGGELVRRLRADEKLAAIPICTMSAMGRLEGVAEALHKPFDIGALLDVVSRIAGAG